MTLAHGLSLHRLLCKRALLCYPPPNKAGVLKASERGYFYLIIKVGSFRIDTKGGQT